jgi:hypothetical protein
VTLILEGGELDKPTVTDLLAAEQAKSEQENAQQKEKQQKKSES